MLKKKPVRVKNSNDSGCTRGFRNLVGGELRYSEIIQL